MRSHWPPRSKAAISAMEVVRNGNPVFVPLNFRLAAPEIAHVLAHCGAHTDGAMDAMGWGSLLDCLAVLRGEDPAHPLVPKPSVTFQIKTRSAPTMYFIGVTTVKSSIMKVPLEGLLAAACLFAPKHRSFLRYGS